LNSVIKIEEHTLVFRRRRNFSVLFKIPPLLFSAIFVFIHILQVPTTLIGQN